MSYRLCGADDWRAVQSALLRLEQYSKEYEWAIAIDVNASFINIRAVLKAGNGYVVDGYLVLVDEVTPWYSSKPILTEWLVLKLEAGGTVDSVPKALVEIAKERGIGMVMTADSSPVSIVAGAYNRAGFDKLTTSFYKVL